MLKLMREASIAIRGSSSPSWGSSPSPSSSPWAGGGSVISPAPVVASVGDLTVSHDEFRRAYENTYRFYKDKVPGEFKDETIKQLVVDQLIDNRTWLIAAKNMGLTVADDDLREVIMQIPDFQKNGTFDPEIYQRLLAANHLTPVDIRSDGSERSAEQQSPDDHPRRRGPYPCRTCRGASPHATANGIRSREGRRGKGPCRAGRPLSKAATRSNGLHRIAQNDPPHQDQPRIACTPALAQAEVAVSFSGFRLSYDSACQEDQHRITIAVEAVPLANRLCIGLSKKFGPGQCGDQHQQCGPRQVKIREEGIDHLETGTLVS